MNFNEYPKLNLASDVVILSCKDKPQNNIRKVPEKGIQILLVKRNEEPFDRMWSLPGGFVDHDKTIDECVNTKLLEKTGLSNVYMEQLYTYGDVNRDTRGRVISVAYLALLCKDNINVYKKGNLRNIESEWFWLDVDRNDVGDVIGFKATSENGLVSINDLAFDHKKIVIDALNRLQNKIEYTDLAFHLVPKYFTVKELQLTYESILGRSIQAFRRKIENKIIVTDFVKDNNVAYRPAMLYQLNKNTTKLF